MPLKSNGSLCIFEALSRSHSQAAINEDENTQIPPIFEIPCSKMWIDDNNNTNMVEDRGKMGCNDLQLLSLSMSHGSQSSSKMAQEKIVHRKSIRTFGQRTSQYRNLHRWTGRYEAHSWDNSCKEGQTSRGRRG
ncbi:hypothetical protein CDL12_30379 [Handroanthus impetiginosus]|uniref:Uncharacterized protein n=1 Tax=Handroanthus impetiginosus TaxID=429701 RepID=A0A2G9FVQ7_9LAMI|nr:hypothetical protein CDL12_30379 [Handroanthus impetiginosus]